MTWAETFWTIWRDLQAVAWLEWFKVLADLLKGAAWPLGIFLIFFLFRRELRKAIEAARPFLGEITKLKTSWMEVERQQPVEAIVPREKGLEKVEVAINGAPVSPDDPRVQEFINVDIAKLPPAVRRNMDAIHKDLQSIPEDKRVDVLVRELAKTQLARDFESIFGPIFGSQLDFLRFVSASGIVPYSTADTFWHERVLARTEGLKDWDVEQWLNYLIIHDLIRKDGSNLLITDAGSAFLHYVDVVKAGFQRPG